MKLVRKVFKLLFTFLARLLVVPVTIWLITQVKSGAYKQSPMFKGWIRSAYLDVSHPFKALFAFMGCIFELFIGSLVWVLWTPWVGAYIMISSVATYVLFHFVLCHFKKEDLSNEAVSRFNERCFK